MTVQRSSMVQWNITQLLKEQIFAICSKLDGPMYYKVKRQRLHVITYIWNLKNKQMNIITETDSQREQTTGY